MRSVWIPLLAALLSAAFACSPTGEPEQLSPLEEWLQADSLQRISTGDSLARHIGFDYENLNRVAWQKPDVIIDKLGPLEGKTAVDIGAGTGFFTRRLAAEADRVIALDIDAGMLVVLDSINRDRLDTAAYARVEPRLVSPDDPGLAPGEADAALIVNTFMYIENRVDYLSKLAQGLTPGGKVLIVDFKTKSTPVGPPLVSRLPLHVVETALAEAGYRNIRSDDTSLDFQYVVVAERP